MDGQPPDITRLIVTLHLRPTHAYYAYVHTLPPLKLSRSLACTCTHTHTLTLTHTHTHTHIHTHTLSLPPSLSLFLYLSIYLSSPIPLSLSLPPSLPPSTSPLSASIMVINFCNALSPQPCTTMQTTILSTQMSSSLYPGSSYSHQPR